MSFTPPPEAFATPSPSPKPEALAAASPLASSPLVSLLERITHPTSLTDAQDRFLAVNPAFQRLFGYSSVEVIGLSPRLLIPTSVPEEQLRAIRQQLVEQRQPWHGTLPHLRRNGATFDPRLHLLPLHPDQHLPPAGYISVWADPQDALEAILQLGTAFAAALLAAPPPAPPNRSAGTKSPASAPLASATRTSPASWASRPAPSACSNSRTDSGRRADPPPRRRRHGSVPPDTPAIKSDWPAPARTPQLRHAFSCAPGPASPPLRPARPFRHHPHAPA